ncbi:PREDICTED: ribosomal L1 domain-containing protein 1-like [Nelumbo nucifera]|uniref:Ribosomal L1 domain-containing protein 1-like n=2 Tax=Nelumbo nucifera TaxID=4432 RepID=A0A1U7ZIH6_NELNU|nr:PREDICTED: ribosomal L1 domain-containing protein 1-like [Nelumbo nucifera]DAD48336.1 TPA_asm: hypothetical protein HUJ06_018273 [Nelumbo nucifera]
MTSNNPSAPSSRVSSETVGKAVDALLKWINAKKKQQNAQLFEEDDFVYLILTLKKIPEQGRTNPYKISLPHPLHDTSEEEICLIIDDRPKSRLTFDAATKKVEADNIPVNLVLRLSQLRSDYRNFEKKRQLCNSFDIFFADKRIIPLLPRLLGKQFFKRKKIPVPVDLTHKNWKEQIEFASGSALLYLRTGTCCVLKVARISMGRDGIVENVVAAINGVGEIVPKKWANVRSFHLKLLESLALPLYQTVPQMGMKIEGIKKKEEASKEELGSGVESGEKGNVEKKEKKLEKKKVSKKGRIHEVRYMDDDFDEFLDDDKLDNDEEANEDSKSETAELTGKKRKKGEIKKEGVLNELNGEKQPSKLEKVKKGDTLNKQEVLNEISGKKQQKKPAKMKKGDFSLELGEKVVDEPTGDISVEKKKKKEKNKLGKSGIGKMKIKVKKSKKMQATE